MWVSGSLEIISKYEICNHDIVHFHNLSTSRPPLRALPFILLGVKPENLKKNQTPIIFDVS